MKPGVTDLTTQLRGVRGTGMQPLLAFLCGHRGAHAGSSFKCIPGRAHARIPWRCATCTAAAKALKAAA